MIESLILLGLWVPLRKQSFKKLFYLLALAIVIFTGIASYFLYGVNFEKFTLIESAIAYSLAPIPAAITLGYVFDKDVPVKHLIFPTIFFPIITFGLSLLFFAIF